MTCHMFVMCLSYVVFPVVGGEKERMREKKETTDNLLFKNLRGRWRPQYSDWPVLAFPSTGHYMLASPVFFVRDSEIVLRRLVVSRTF